MDDVALVAAVQQGNEEALADLFEDCHGWTYSTCLNALRDPEAAEEATARVFETAIRTRLAGAHALRPALIRLIHDTCNDVENELVRKKWLRRKGEQPPAAPDPKDLRLVAWRAAGDLSPQDRILFALAAGMALTNESIALAVAPDKPAAIAKRLDQIREHVVADVLAARSLDDCPELRDTLRYSAKEPDAAARKKVHAHVAGRGRGVEPCAKCAKAYERWPLAALAALLPLTAVPAGLNDRLLDRMELALRTGLAAGTDRVRAVTAVIDGTTGEPVAVAGRAETLGRRGRPGPFATTAVLTATVLVLGTAGVLALAADRVPAHTTDSLVTDSTPPVLPAEPAAVRPARPGLSPTPRKTRPSAPQKVEIPVVRTSPTASTKPSIRPIVGSAAPTTPADPFAGFGTLTVVSPAAGSTVTMYDADARLASVTLSVAVPDGFDTALLDSTLTWSGSYVRQKETQYADLGSGQGITVDLQGAARCRTVWTITATLTPPTGAPQYSTVDVSVSC